MDNPYAAPSTDVAHAELDVAGAAPYSIAQIRAAFVRFAWSYWGHVGSLVLLFGVLAVLAVQAAMQGKAASEAELQQFLLERVVSVGAISLVTIITGVLVITLVLVTVFALILLYRYWAVMQPYTKRTTPGKAVGFLFIPLFQFYWLFVAYHGLAKVIDTYLDTHRTSVAPRPSSGMIRVTIILMLVSLLPFFINASIVAAIATLALLVLLILAFLSQLQLNNSIIGIIQDRARQLASAVPSK